MPLEICVLGCGSSAGTPMIGCDCAVCVSTDPRNQRSRCSAWIRRWSDTAPPAAGSARPDPAALDILIDTGPDLRTQALREGMRRLDAVLYTHMHADHLNGIDDMRAFCQRQKAAIPIYGDAGTIANIYSRFTYALLCPGMPPRTHWDLPAVYPQVVESSFTLGTGGVREAPPAFPEEAPDSSKDERRYTVQPQTVVAIPVWHGKITIYAWRIGGWVWMTDVSAVPESSWPLLQNIEVLFLDCLREQAHPAHLSINQAIALAERIGAAQTFFIHMTHEIDYTELAHRLPARMAPAYDGLRLRADI